jgi:hypothetical protein
MARSITTFKKSNAKGKRKGIHAKSKTSKLKTSKNYMKKYIGQGR